MALADGVFAIVLTLLVLDLRAPQAESNAELWIRLRALTPALATFVISFAIVAVFWYGHHMESHWIERSDRIHIGITLLLLLTICFVPFSAALLSRNPGLALAATVYGANLCAAGSIRYAHWVYATAGRRLVARTVDPSFARTVSRIFLLIVALYLVAIGIAWLNTTVAIVAFALIPVLYVIPARQTRHLTSLPRANWRD